QGGVALLFKLGNRSPACLGGNSVDLQAADLRRQLRRAEIRPASFLAGAEMPQVMRDAAGTASQVIRHVGTDHWPAQSGSIGQCEIDVTNVGNAGGNHIDGFAPEGRREALGNMTACLALETNRYPPKTAI